MIAAFAVGVYKSDSTPPPDAVYQNQILYQTCVTVMEYNATECEPFLGTDRASDEVKVCCKEIGNGAYTYLYPIMYAISRLGRAQLGGNYINYTGVLRIYW